MDSTYTDKLNHIAGKTIECDPCSMSNETTMKNDDSCNEDHHLARTGQVRVRNHPTVNDLRTGTSTSIPLVVGTMEATMRNGNMIGFELTDSIDGSVSLTQSTYIHRRFSLCRRSIPLSFALSHLSWSVKYGSRHVQDHHTSSVK